MSDGPGPRRLPPRHRLLLDLTHLPTVSGREDAVIDYITRWVGRRSDLRLRHDTVGNLLVSRTGRRPRRAPVVAVAHMDHPGFVVVGVDGRRIVAEFRGGVMDPYFSGSRVEFFPAGRSSVPGTVADVPADGRVAVELTGAGVSVGDIGRWRFPARSLGIRGDRLRAPGCDDLAGVAAALSALDRARSKPDLGHFMVLLTRAEEMGFVGAIGAARTGTLPEGAMALSIETSRAFPDSPIGAGPIVRVGDASTVFDADLTNALSAIARTSGRPFQRKLMAGGSCEATAFGAYGVRATGICLALANYHNMADIDGVSAGTAEARVMPEEISLDDYDGLIRLLVDAASGLKDGGGTHGLRSSLTDRLDALYEQRRHLLSG